MEGERERKPGRLSKATCYPRNTSQQDPFATLAGYNVLEVGKLDGATNQIRPGNQLIPESALPICC